MKLFTKIPGHFYSDFTCSFYQQKVKIWGSVKKKRNQENELNLSRHGANNHWMREHLVAIHVLMKPQHYMYTGIYLFILLCIRRRFSNIFHAWCQHDNCLSTWWQIFFFRFRSVVNMAETNFLAIGLHSILFIAQCCMLIQIITLIYACVFVYVYHYAMFSLFSFEFT